MKKVVMCAVMLAMTGCSMFHRTTKLTDAPPAITRFGEIAVLYDQRVAEYFNELHPEERVFVYYLWRAGLPGYRITADQLHRCAQPLQELFELIVDNEKILLAHKGLNAQFALRDFLEQARTYLVYLWTNHSQYFLLEHEHEKRTPHKLGLELLTKENIAKVLEVLGKNADDFLSDDLVKALFDDEYHATLTVPGNINKSAVNTYGPGFCERDYAALSVKQRSGVNAYFCHQVDEHGKKKPVVQQYAIGQRCSQEMDVIQAWLTKARDHAKKYPTLFDEHVVESLTWLITFIQTGDEDFFKKYSVAWLKTKSRIDFNFGFVETYRDPKNKVGLFQAEATIKTVDMSACNQALFIIEQTLPIPATYSRFTKDEYTRPTLPNASMNAKCFAIGDLGPLEMTAAYCLPNYEDIRAQHGSKQIMYPATKGIGALLNPDVHRQLFHRKQRAEWLAKHDPDSKIVREMWDVQCLLHETVGHGSGKLGAHTFRTGDQLTVHGKKYHVGDSIPVTTDNLTDLLGGYESALEELRAEVIALYACVVDFDVLTKLGYFKRWTSVITKADLIDWLIEHMALAGLSRLIHQKNGATVVQGEHSRADYAILNYLLDRNAVEVVQETTSVGGQEVKVVDVKILDQRRAIDAIKALVCKVQTIKSTGDGQAAKELFTTYGTTIRHVQEMAILKTNKKMVNGNLKIKALLSPLYEPVCDNKGVVTDVQARWPNDIFDYFMQIRKLELCKL